MAAILRHRFYRPQEERAGTQHFLSLYIVLVLLMTVPAFTATQAMAGSVDPLERILGVGQRVSLPTGDSLLAAVPVKPGTGGSFSSAAPLDSPARLQEQSITFQEHPSISAFVQKHVVRGPDGFQRMLERAWVYLPIMKEILDVVGAPSDLLAVVCVESRFRGQAKSGAGAAGFWQLMPKTARTLGLRVDGWVDERFDPIKSTRAAAVYLMDLYEQFGSWEMALAAYNVGDGAVRQAMSRYRTEDFWTLYRRKALPHQTRQFVPKVLGAVKVLNNFKDYGLEKPNYEPLWAFTTVWVHHPLSLSQASAWTGVPLEVLKRLNPALRRDQIPSGTGYQLRLPPAAVEDFLMAYEKLMNKKS